MIHLTTSTWTPPAKSSAVTPTTNALSDAKYGITHDPNTATQYIMTGGYYASTLWYQPKFAASYTLVGRYGTGDYVGAYCI